MLERLNIMNSILVQHQLADLHHEEMLRQAENARNSRLADTRSPNLLRSVAQTLVRVGEKLQEAAPTSWSITQPEPHLVK
jgi:cell division protein ZapA (FtsZ GTPase activity inhibitor)